MRIISQYHDYYDSVLSFGIDPNCRYIRKTSTFIEDDKDIPAEAHAIWNNPTISRLLDKLPQVTKPKNDDYLSVRSSFILLFCGKVYPCIYMGSPTIRNEFSKKKSWIRYCYTYDEAADFLKKYADYNTKKNRWRRYTYTGPFSTYNKLDDRNIVDIYKGNVSNSEILDIHHATGVPSISITRKEITYNPILRDLRFYKVADSYSTFQQLSQFISGILGGVSPPMIEISNDVRIQKHGFDLKTSFRKSKQNE